jgi:hypothetical protein
MAGEPLDIQRLEVSCAAARHGSPLRRPWRREGSARTLPRGMLAGEHLEFVRDG